MASMVEAGICLVGSTRRIRRIRQTSTTRKISTMATGLVLAPPAAATLTRAWATSQTRRRPSMPSPMSSDCLQHTQHCSRQPWAQVLGLHGQNKHEKFHGCKLGSGFYSGSSDAGADQVAAAESALLRRYPLAKDAMWQAHWSRCSISEDVSWQLEEPSRLQQAMLAMQHP